MEEENKHIVDFRCPYCNKVVSFDRYEKFVWCPKCKSKSVVLNDKLRRTIL